MPSEILKAIVKSGILGGVLAWALYENHLLNDRLFGVIENNTRALTGLQDILRGK